MDTLFEKTLPTTIWTDNLTVTHQFCTHKDIKNAPVYGSKVVPAGTINQAINALTGKKQPCDLVTKINMLVDPGKLCLVLGNPAQINSTLLREITSGTNKNNHESRVHYSDLLSKSQLVYCSSKDLHFPFLTVRQTLDFDLSWKFPDMGSAERRKVSESLLDALGMGHTFNTKVGNELFSGISGGERRRLSLLESLIAGGSVTCLDNATRGLDSATASRVLDVLRDISRKHNSSFIMTLYQGSQEVYEKFDLVLILFQGKQVYFGPANGVESYFNKLGYRRENERQTTMELVDLILDTELPFAQKKEIIVNQEVPEDQIPRTPEQFVKAWESSAEFQQLRDSIEAQSSRCGSRRGQSNKLPSPSCSLKRGSSLLWNCMRRNFANNVRSWPFYAAQLISMVFLAICIGTLFLRLKMDTMGSFSRGSVIFFALLLFTFIAVSDVAINFGNSIVVSRQSRSYGFYQPWMDSLSDVIAQIPFKLLEELIFLIILYFLVNMNGNASGFFSFYLFLSLAMLVIDELYHLIARLSSTIAVATSVSGVALLWLAMYATYVVQQQQIKVWFKYWLMYTNPLMYAFESLITTQLHKKIMHCNNIIPSGSTFYDSIPYQHRICAWQGASIGNDYVRGDEYLQQAFGYSYSHVWRNMGILFGMLAGFTAIELVGIQFTIRAPKVSLLKFIYQGKKDSDTEPIIEQNQATEKDDSVSVSRDYSGETMDVEKPAPEQCFAWSKLSYFLPNGECLLHDISGYVRSGELVALMGASGAGKTTLLNALSGRYKSGCVNAANISIPKGPVGYVEQQEMFVEQLTVREALETYANLHSESLAASFKGNIDELLDLLSLTKYSDFRLSGLPLEQRKKASLAIELVNRPTLLFVDEITSGLDDLSAYNIIRCLQNLARRVHLAILCTVHQPSPSLIRLFDRLLLLKSDGYQAYYGTITNTVSFFQHHGLRPCRKNENFVDYMIELTGDESVDWHKYWHDSKDSSDLDNELESIFGEKTQNEVTRIETNKQVNLNSKSSSRGTYWSHFHLILKRTCIEMYRNENYVLAKLGLYIFSGLFIGFSFWKVDHTIKSLQSSMFAIFLVLCVCAPLIHQIQDRCNSSKLLYETREFRLYHWSILPLSQVLVEAPFAIICASISYLCFYFTWGINNNSTRAGYFYLDYAIMFQLYYVTFSVGVLYFSPNLLISDVYSSLFFALMVVFCGAMQPFTMIPAFWKYTVYYESPFTYFLENMMTELFHDRPVVCAANEMALLLPGYAMTCGAYMKEYIHRKGGYLRDPTQFTYCTYCSYKNGQEFTNDLNMYFHNHWRNFGIMWAFVIGNIALMLIFYKGMLMFRQRNRGVSKAAKKGSVVEEKV